MGHRTVCRLSVCATLVLWIVGCSVDSQPRGSDTDEGAGVSSPRAGTVDVPRRQLQPGPDFTIEPSSEDRLVGSGRNPDHGFRVDFASDRPWLRPAESTDGEPAWRLGLRFVRIGRADRMRRVPPVEARTVDGNRVAYLRHGRTTIEEWYLNGPLGLEQGFDIATRPAGPAGAPLVLEIAPDGNLRPALRDDDTIALNDRAGRTRLVYRKLLVRDDDGDQVPASMEVHDGRIRLVIEDADATYPIVVDPRAIGPGQTITSNADGARALTSENFDGDSDYDLVSASANDNTVAWHENDGTGSFTAHEITTSASGAWDVETMDVDDDGDVDILSAAKDGNTIAWHENDTNQFPRFNNSQPLIQSLSEPRDIATADINFDGCTDFVTASSGDSTIAWHESSCSQTPS